MSDIFSNSVLQSFIFSSLMGVLFGVLFAGVSAKPTDSSPKTIIETRTVYIDRGAKQRKNKSNGGELYGFAILLFFAAWKYLQFAPTVLYYLELTLVSMLSFGLACFTVSTIKRHYIDIDWAHRVLVPTIILGLCLVILAKAKRVITPDLVELASRSNFIEFFMGLSQYGRIFSVFHIVGLFLLIFIAIIGTLSLFHYLALMNLRSESPISDVWSFITRVTFRFSSSGVYVLSVVLIGVSAFMVDGTIAHWVTPANATGN